MGTGTVRVATKARRLLRANRDAGLRPAPQRLCLGSSGLPWLTVSEDGVEDGQEFVGDRDGGDHLRFSGGQEPLVEGLENGVVPFGDLSAEEQDCAHGGSTTTDVCLPLPPSGLTH